MVIVLRAAMTVLLHAYAENLLRRSMPAATLQALAASVL
jgi:hypothetical protein